MNEGYLIHSFGSMLAKFRQCAFYFLISFKKFCMHLQFGSFTFEVRRIASIYIQISDIPQFAVQDSSCSMRFFVENLHTNSTKGIRKYAPFCLSHSAANLSIRSWNVKFSDVTFEARGSEIYYQKRKTTIYTL